MAESRNLNSGFLHTSFVDFDFTVAKIITHNFTNKRTFKDHLEKLERILARLQQAGLKVNANKPFFARSELEYLGYCDDSRLVWRH